jgi:hypothetical protein
LAQDSDARGEEKGDSKADIVLFTLHPSSCRRWAGRSPPRPWVDPSVARAGGLSVSMLQGYRGILTRGRFTETVPCDLAVSGPPSPCELVSIGSVTIGIDFLAFFDISGSKSMRVLWRVGVVDNPACLVDTSPSLPEAVVLEVAAYGSVSVDSREARALHTLVEPSSLCSGPSPRFLP